MELSWTPEQQAFRSRLVAFLDEHLSSEWEAVQHLGPGAPEVTQFAYGFCPKLAEAGFLTPHWPVEYGGGGGSAWEHLIVGEELWARGEPRGGQYMNVNWIGPTLIEYGSADQKRRFLPPMAAGKVLWCQGFSEPDSGSDLASLRTRADRDGDEYVINGQKIWTSYAGMARHCFLLARTGGERRSGISIFLIDMDTPGISVRMIPSLLGDGDIHEVFFDDVRVPASTMLGEPGQGWPIITYALKFERIGIARYELSRRALERMVGWLQKADRFRSEALRTAAAAAVAACDAARYLVYKIADQRANGLEPTPETSLARWAVITADHMVANFAQDHVPELLAADGDHLVIAQHERAIASGLAGGAAEIQLGIVATQYLELPREAVR